MITRSYVMQTLCNLWGLFLCKLSKIYDLEVISIIFIKARILTSFSLSAL